MKMIKFQRAVKQLKECKTSGIDEIPSELLKLGGEELRNRSYELILQIDDAAVMPEDFEKNIILIPKRVGAGNCKDFRTLCLTNHASKIVCRIIKWNNMNCPLILVK